MTWGAFVGSGLSPARFVGATNHWKHSAYVAGVPFPWSMFRQPIHFAWGAMPIWFVPAVVADHRSHGVGAVLVVVAGDRRNWRRRRRRPSGWHRASCSRGWRSSRSSPGTSPSGPDGPSRTRCPARAMTTPIPLKPRAQALGAPVFVIPHSIADGASESPCGSGGSFFSVTLGFAETRRTSGRSAMRRTTSRSPRTQIMFAIQYGRNSAPRLFSSSRTGACVRAAVSRRVLVTSSPFSSLVAALAAAWRDACSRRKTRNSVLPFSLAVDSTQGSTLSIQSGPWASLDRAQPEMKRPVTKRTTAPRLWSAHLLSSSLARGAAGPQEYSGRAREPAALRRASAGGSQPAVTGTC